jgi:HAD superfamily hydrolase (TIGR01509 family)
VPRGILVDIGETLFREQPMDRRAAADALAREARFAPYLPDSRTLEAAHEEGASGSETWTVLGWLGRMLPAALAREAEILVWETGVRMAPMPGAADALATFRAAGVPTGAVSNTRFSAHAWAHVLETRGLAVDFVVSSADVGARKPDPRIFRAALERLGLPARDVWFVGDSLEKDVRGALAMGLTPVWFGAPSPPPGPLSSCIAARDWAKLLDLWKGSRSPRVS